MGEHKIQPSLYCSTTNGQSCCKDATQVREALQKSLRRLADELVQADKELVQADKNVRALKYKLSRAQDEERRRLALELHDSTGQWLAALRWKMAALRDDIVANSPTLEPQVSEALHMIDELSKEVRTMCQVLYPPSLDEAGLSEALRAYVDGISVRSGLEVKLHVDPELGPLPREIAMAVLRIVQESLTNVHRHARTNSAHVSLTQNSESICIEIQDHGQGIPDCPSFESAKARMGVGLRGMRERAQQVDGKFEVKSGSSGTIVKVTLPIRKRPD
jgi:signal transduction histidine kinase